MGGGLALYGFLRDPAAPFPNLALNDYLWLRERLHLGRRVHFLGVDCTEMFREADVIAQPPDDETEHPVRDLAELYLTTTRLTGFVWWEN